MPTPGIAYLTRTFHAQAGIVISASHNPFDDNGIKFFSAAGTKLPDSVELEIERELETPFETVTSRELGKAHRVVDAAGRYIEFCKSTVATGLDLGGLTIALDCAHGATYHIAPDVFEELGANVIALGNEPDGFNINEGVGATSPELLQRAVREHEAHVGIALDGDGDRLIMVDHRGRVVDGDELTYVIAGHRRRLGRLGGTVVGTLMSNFGLELALRRDGLDFRRAAVGDRYILEMLDANAWTVGGESSGHIICLDLTTTGDGIISALQVLEAMAQTGETLAALAAGMSKFPQKLINVKVADGAEVASAPVVKQAVAEAEARLGGQGRVLLRPSGTEPVVRVMVEGREEALVGELAQFIADAVRGALSAPAGRAA
jgi:phosphoglucosamine mutase